MTDRELLALMPDTMRDEFSYAAKVCSDATGGQVKPGIFRVALNTAALEYARAVLGAANSKPTPNPSQISSSLVERVEGALMKSVKEQGSMARAAIREVVAWLKKSDGVLWIMDQSLFNLGETTSEDFASKAISVIAELLELEAER
jgi:hypothetical protein